MRYFKLKHFIDDNQQYTDILSLVDGYNILSDYSYSNLKPYQKYDGDLWLEFCIDNQYKISDLMDLSLTDTADMLVSQKLYSFLSKFNLPSHQVFLVKLNYQNEVFEYIWIHFIEPFDYSSINYEKTSFFAEDTESFFSTETNGILGDFKVSSWSEFCDLRNFERNDYHHRYIVPKSSLYIDSDFTLDIANFDFLNFSEILVVSEKMADQMIKNCFSGIKLEQCDFDIVSRCSV